MNKTAKFQRDNGVEAYRKMPVRFGKVKATVFGGPFAEYVSGQRRVVSVKMAKEVDVPADITVPTQDFGVPSHPAMHAAVRKALEAILDGNDLYVGCGYGIGRTGTFMACLAKVMIDYDARDGVTTSTALAPYIGDENGPLRYVRGSYLSGAVETAAQEKFIREFDTASHVAWLSGELEPKVVEVPVVEYVTKEVPVYTFNPFAAWMSMFGKRQ